jgi:3-oxoacyl-[acyl-carrier protein] reductase
MKKIKKNVLITGSNRGIGKAILECYNNKDYVIYGLGKKNTHNKNYYSIDLSKNKDVLKFIKIIKKLKIDILINNAGINKIENFHKIKFFDLKKIFHVNFFSAYLISQAVIPNMIKNRWGRIINITSIFANSVKELRSSYVSSKFALNGLTKCMAAEYSNRNILINAVAPGVTKTDLTKKILKNKIHLIKKKIPMNRLAEPKEIADVVYFLGSEENTFITGQQILVDGGYTIV